MKTRQKNETTMFTHWIRVSSGLWVKHDDYPRFLCTGIFQISEQIRQIQSMVISWNRGDRSQISERLRQPEFVKKSTEERATQWKNSKNLQRVLWAFEYIHTQVGLDSPGKEQVLDNSQLNHYRSLRSARRQVSSLECCDLTGYI